MLECTSSERKNINRDLGSQFSTDHSLTQVYRIVEEGKTLGLDKKKTTAVRSASYCFGLLLFWC